MIDKNMNSTCVQRESVLPLHKYQSNSIMESKSLHTAWQAGTTRVSLGLNWTIRYIFVVKFLQICNRR
jgi:hypothetical protein